MWQNLFLEKFQVANMQHSDSHFHFFRDITTKFLNVSKEL